MRKRKGRRRRRRRRRERYYTSRRKIGRRITNRRRSKRRRKHLRRKKLVEDEKIIRRRRMRIRKIRRGRKEEWEEEKKNEKKRKRRWRRRGKNIESYTLCRLSTREIPYDWISTWLTTIMHPSLYSGGSRGGAATRAPKFWSTMFVCLFSSHFLSEYFELMLQSHGTYGRLRACGTLRAVRVRGPWEVRTKLAFCDVCGHMV